jgi:hypothetical protein
MAEFTKEVAIFWNLQYIPKIPKKPNKPRATRIGRTSFMPKGKCSVSLYHM